MRRALFRPRTSVGAMTNYRHGHARNGAQSTEYKAWAGMIERCHNPDNKKYPAYGARGIRVCARWRTSFPKFLADMGQKPAGFSLERKNNSRGYGPRNCIWAGPKTQARNRRNNKIVTMNGRQMSLAEAVETAGADYGRVALRLRRGWSFARAISEPAHG